MSYFKFSFKKYFTLNGEQVFHTFKYEKKYDINLTR